ncbi:MAG: ankyrin repeat domain-containing protein, partial [Candidatus Cloacimonetes bacterium]|nr:ankyrin repeat domain-containing protein [Candidatus Cloacimonadota bacterium]
DVNARDNEGITALMYAAWYNDDPEVVKVLIAAGADINATNNYLFTPLMYSAWLNDNPDVTKALIE